MRATARERLPGAADELVARLRGPLAAGLATRMVATGVLGLVVIPRSGRCGGRRVARTGRRRHDPRLRPQRRTWNAPISPRVAAAVRNGQPDGGSVASRQRGGRGDFETAAVASTCPTRTCPSGRRPPSTAV